MSRVITFSTVFPAYHPKAGQPTYFVEKIVNGLADLRLEWYESIWDTINPIADKSTGIITQAKYHTIRAGNRWKVGDKFSPRIWGDNINPKSGKKGAYQSDQIIIAPDIEVKKVWIFEIRKSIIHGHTEVCINDIPICSAELEEISKNDGLSTNEFLDWFKYPKSFKGQIICWNNDINY